MKPEDLGGSTFTITSLGKHGGLFATPIINFPEVGILGVHQIKQKPVVRDGQIVIGDVMLLSLSFDHRIIDGHVGARSPTRSSASRESRTLFLEMAVTASASRDPRGKVRVSTPRSAVHLLPAAPPPPHTVAEVASRRVFQPGLT